MKSTLALVVDVFKWLSASANEATFLAACGTVIERSEMTLMANVPYTESEVQSLSHAMMEFIVEESRIPSGTITMSGPHASIWEGADQLVFAETHSREFLWSQLGVDVSPVHGGWPVTDESLGALWTAIAFHYRYCSVSRSEFFELGYLQRFVRLCAWQRRQSHDTNECSSIAELWRLAGEALVAIACDTVQ